MIFCTEFELVMNKLRQDLLLGDWKQVSFLMLTWTCNKQMLLSLLTKMTTWKSSKQFMLCLSEQQLNMTDWPAENSLWAVQTTRPDLAYDMVNLSTKLRSGSVADLIHINKMIRRLKEEPALVFLPDLGEPSIWQLITYTDASRGNLRWCGQSWGPYCSIVWTTGQVLLIGVAG